MSRKRCEGCDRPVAVCLCDHWVQVTSPVKVVILQHPSERKQALATVPILQHCLSPLMVWVGEEFGHESQAEQHAQINKWLADSAGVRVLYPATSAEQWDCSLHNDPACHERAAPVRQRESTANIHTLIVVDGTWRKAKRIWHLNSWLQAIPSACLTGLPASNYRIRASQVEGGVSTLEAVVAALNYLTDDLTNDLASDSGNDPTGGVTGQGRFDELIKPFAAMVDMQIKKMGADVFNAHYGKQESKQEDSEAD